MGSTRSGTAATWALPLRSNLHISRTLTQKHRWRALDAPGRQARQTCLAGLPDVPFLSPYKLHCGTWTTNRRNTALNETTTAATRTALSPRHGGIPGCLNHEGW